MSFDTAFAKTVGLEGRHSNNPNDRGGATMFGITERVARANGYTGDMRNLGLETAKRIAKAQYWDIMSLDAIDAISPRIAAEMFDTFFNGGHPDEWLQRCLNVFNREGSLYPDMAVDGKIGPVTISALREFISKRGVDGETVMLKALNCLQGCRFIGIAEHDESQETFVFGWLLKRVEI